MPTNKIFLEKSEEWKNKEKSQSWRRYGPFLGLKEAQRTSQSDSESQVFSHK